MAKEEADRKRTGSAHPGDRCRARIGAHVCDKLPGHPKKHRDLETGKEWSE
jgi:hypothetical protein